jgi:mRNA-degrading endonuclease RelE of RelBE toxin-antitoxin system
MRAVASRIDFTRQADEHVAELTAHRRARLFDAIDKQLLHEPTVESRNRNPMRVGKRTFVAPWELRVADMRVYYDVQEEPEPVVVIEAVGIKVRSRVMLGGKEIEP